MKINIKQMAAKAGVSVATISRVMNPETRDKVAPATRARIETLVKKFKYTPNLAGRNLRQTSTKNIGLIIPYFKDLFFSFYYTQILSAVSESLLPTGYRFKLLILRKEERNWDHYDFKSGEQVDGLIISLWSQVFSDSKVFHKIGVPCVLVDDCNAAARALCVSADHFRGGQLAAEYLYEKGHRRFAIINGPEWSTDCQLRVDGFVGYLKSRNIKVGSGLIFNAGFSPEKAYECAQKILERKPLISAIFGCTDHIAMGTIRAIKDTGLRCPEDISVIGYDDDFWMNYIGLKLTTIHFPVAEIAREATAQLIQHLNAKKFHEPLTGQILIPVSVVERETVHYR